MEQIVEIRKLSELKQYSENPRNITKEKFDDLKTKIKRFGQLGALLIDGRDRTTILGGNHAYLAMIDLGMEEAKVEYRTPKDDSEALELVILHNERFASWVEQDLAELLHKHKETIDLSNYTIDLGKMTQLKNVLARYGEADEDEAPPLEDGEPKSRFGEVYQLGRHRLMCGDSTSIEDVKRLMGGETASVLVTDPPYGVSYEGNPNGQEWDMIENDDLRGDKLLMFLIKAFENAAEVGIKNLPAYSFYASSTHIEFQKALEAAGFKIRQQIIWVKHMVIGNSDYHWTHEPILYAGHGKDRPPFYGDRTNRTVIDTAGYKDLKTLSKEALLGLIMAMKNESTAIQVSKDTQQYEHPTQKPVAIMAPLIKNSSAVDEIVLDLFTGSGSTLIAAHQLDRKAYCMEFDPKFCDVIRKRYARYIKEDMRWEQITSPLDK